MGRRYNYIYNRLVENENDIIGHIAYSLYKSGKAKYIAKFKEDNRRDIKEDDLAAFHEMSCMPDEIARYKLQATSILQSFTNDTLSSSIKQIEEDTVHRHEEILRNIVKDMRPPKFWHGVWQSIIGAFLFMMIMCFLLFLLNFSDNTYTFSIGGNSAKIEQSKQSPE